MRGLFYCVGLAFVVSCTRSVAPPRLVAAHYEGPIQSRDVAEGGRIYLTLCAACHKGRVNPSGYNWSPGQMRQQIREGNRLMPPIRPDLLTDEQVEAVLAYLVVIDAIDGEVPPERHFEAEYEMLFPEDETSEALDTPAGGVEALELSDFDNTDPTPEPETPVSE